MLPASKHIYVTTHTRYVSDPCVIKKKELLLLVVNQQANVSFRNFEELTMRRLI
jgi:hypothetical protein